MMLTIEKLENGIQVVLEEIGYVRSISFGIWVKNGTRNERPEENGISHYIEHMMFKGTETALQGRLQRKWTHLADRSTLIPQKNILVIIPVCWTSM